MRVKKHARLCAAILVFAALLPAPHTRAEQPNTDAKGAVLMDQRTRRVLASENAHARLPMASTTKVMTALLALESGALTTLITVPKEAHGVEGSSMYLSAGEKLTMEDLLYGLMLVSGNDAAITIAVHLGGSVEGFAQLMNERARAIGAVNTNFVTPNGLPDDNHYTTAYDLALICCEAMDNPDFRTIVSAQYWKTSSGDTPRTLKNKNKILWQYEGGNGIKTGFTKAAGRCLTFSAAREGNCVVGVALNSPAMWETARTLLDYGFFHYTWTRAVSADEVYKRVRVEQGMQESLEIVAKKDILIPIGADEDKGILAIRAEYPDVVQAPVRAGQALGKIEVYVDGRLIAFTPLIARSTVYKKEYRYYLGRILEEWVG